MKNQIVLTDIDGLITELCENLPNGLRQLADAIDSKRMTGRYQSHVTHGFSPRGFGLRLTLDLGGNVVMTEQAPAMLEDGQ